MVVAIPCRSCHGVLATLGPGDLEEVIRKLAELRDEIAAGEGRAPQAHITAAPSGQLELRWKDRPAS